MCEESREHADALLLGVGVGHEALEGERLALGEVEDGAFVGAPEGDLLIEASGLVGSGHNEENGDIDVPREGGHCQRHAVGQHLQADMGLRLAHRGRSRSNCGALSNTSLRTLSDIFCA